MKPWKHWGRVLTAMVTPFNADHSVDFAGAARLAEYLVNNGSDGLVLTGSTGEAATMSSQEKLELYQTVLAAVGDKAVIIAGTGTYDTYASRRLSIEAARLGVHGIMLVCPYYNKPPQAGLYNHFKLIAEAVPEMPIILYNIPGRTACNLLPATVAQLSLLPNIVSIKEASGSLEQVAEIIRLTPPDFMVYSGDDSLALPIMALGGTGVISVAAHVAGSRIQAMLQAFADKDHATAQTLQAQLLPLFKAMFVTTNPIPVKAALTLAGQPAGPLRPPLLEASADETAAVRQIMAALNLL